MLLKVNLYYIKNDNWWQIIILHTTMTKLLTLTVKFFQF